MGAQPGWMLWAEVGFVHPPPLDPRHWWPRLEQSELSPAKAFVGITFVLQGETDFHMHDITDHAS